MASWIIHLRVADALMEHFSELSPTEFIYGNIAPDSGVPNEDNSGFTPPKTVSHFQKTVGGHRLSGYDIYADEYLTAAKLAEYDLASLSFHLGCFSHLLTDFMWSKMVAVPTFERDWDNVLKNKAAAAKKYKTDWYDLDFRYLRDHPDFRAFEIYRDTASFPNVYLDFFPRDAFDRRKGYITEFYSEHRENLDREYPWLTPEQADGFVETAIETVKNHLEKYLRKSSES